MKLHTAFLTIVGLTSALLLAGCSAPSSPATGPAATTGDAGANATADPKVRRMVMAVTPPSTESNDPRGQRGPTNWVYRPFYEFLVGVDPASGKYIPQLATKWELQPDGQSFKFTLRPGVKFHQDKGEFGPEALIDTFKLETRDAAIEGINPSSNIRGALLPLIDSIEKTGPNEVLMKLKAPDGTFMLTISEQRGIFYMLNAKHFAELGVPNYQTGPAAGTGPYQFKERAEGQYIRYERVPYQHWNVRADFPEFEFRFMKEASTRMASLLANEVHMAELPDDLKLQAQSRGYTLLAGKVPGLRSFIKIYCCHLKDRNDLDSGWQHPDSPLADVRVRKALAKAIDLAQINKSFFRGQGEVMYNAHFHPTRQGWDPTWEKRYPAEYGYDPEAAKKLLADAGYSAAKPMETNIVFPTEGYGYSGGDDMMEAIAGMWRAVGVKVNYATIDTARRTQLTQTQGMFNHLVLGGTAADTWTGITSYGSAASTYVGTGMEVPEADKLLNKIKVTLDETAQEKLWRDIGEALFTQHREIPLAWIPVESTVNPQVVAGYTFPGGITGAWTHVANIKAAR